MTDEIFRNAKKLFTESWKGEPLRLIGVALTNLTDESFEQLSLFEDNEKKERTENWTQLWTKSDRNSATTRSHVQAL